MIEEMRENYKIKKLLDIFRLSLISTILIFFVKSFLLRNDDLIVKEFLSCGQYFLISVAFQAIFISVIAHMGKLKKIYNKEFFIKVSGLNLIFNILYFASKNLISKSGLSVMVVLAIILGIVCSYVLVNLIDKKEK